MAITGSIETQEISGAIGVATSKYYIHNNFLNLTGGTINGDLFVNDLNYNSQIIKAHIITPVDPVQDSWTDFIGYTVIIDETSGDYIEYSADTFVCNHAGIYVFGGCLHFRNENDNGAQIDTTVLMRVYINGTTEARCSQRGISVVNFQEGAEGVLELSGSLRLEEGDTFTVQYYTTNNQMVFNSNPLFDQRVATTLWVNYVGE